MANELEQQQAQRYRLDISNAASRASQVLESRLQANPKEQKIVKQQIADTAGIPVSKVNDKNLQAVDEARRGSAIVMEQGQDPSAVDLDRLRVLGGGKVSDEESAEDKSNQRLIAAALIQTVPIVLGSMFGGAQGGAIGAQAGGVGAGTVLAGMQAEEAKQERLADRKANTAVQTLKLQQEAQKEARQQELENKKLSLQEKEIGVKSKEAELRRLEREADKQAKLDIAKPDQFNAAMYGMRIQQAEDAFEQLAKSGFDPTSKTVAAERLMPELTKSEPLKLQEQAERNFVNAILRRESGAAISDSEFDSAEKQYFPRVGDSKRVLEQKELNRKIALAGLKAAAGPAWNQVNQMNAQIPARQIGVSPMIDVGPQSAIANPALDPATMNRAQLLQFLGGQ